MAACYVIGCFVILGMNHDYIIPGIKAIIKLAINEYAIVSPISVNICFVIPSVNTIGRNTHIVVKVEAKIAPEA